MRYSFFVVFIQSICKYMPNSDLPVYCNIINKTLVNCENLVKLNIARISLPKKVVFFTTEINKVFRFLLTKVNISHSLSIN